MDTVAVFLLFLFVGASHSTVKAATTTNVTTTAETTSTVVHTTVNNTISSIAATTTGTNTSPLTATTTATSSTPSPNTTTTATSSTPSPNTTATATSSTPSSTTATTTGSGTPSLNTTTTTGSSTLLSTTTTTATSSTPSSNTTTTMASSTPSSATTTTTGSGTPFSSTTTTTTGSSTQSSTTTTTTGSSTPSSATTTTTGSSTPPSATTTTTGSSTPSSATTTTTGSSTPSSATTTTTDSSTPSSATTTTTGSSIPSSATTTTTGSSIPSSTTATTSDSSTQTLTTTTTSGSSTTSTLASTTKSTTASSTSTTASTTKTTSSTTRATTSAASTTNDTTTTTTKTTQKPTTPKITIPPKDPEKPSKIVAFQLSLDGDLTQTLNDSESSAYQELERSCVNALTSLHAGQIGFQGVRILGFRSGSIVVRYIVIFEDANLAANEDITSEVETLIQNGNLTSIGNYTVDQSSFREIDISIEDILEAVDQEDLCHGGCTDGKCNLRTAYGVLLTECVCLDNHCKNGGQCSYEDGPKCRCNHDPTGFYMGDRCEFYASQPLVIGLGAGVGGLLLIIIITLSICLCCRRKTEQHNFEGAPLPDNAYWTLYDTMSVTNKTEDTHDEMPLHSVANKRQVHFDNSAGQEENSTSTSTHLANQDRGRVKYQVSSYAAPTWERPTTTNHSFLHGDLRTSDGEENPANESKPGVRNVSIGQEYKLPRATVTNSTSTSYW